MSVKRHASLLALLVLALASALPAAAAERLRINGSTTVNPVVSRAAEVLRSGKTGIFLRQEHGPGFAPSRNVVEANRVVDSGPENGVAIDIEGVTESVTLAKNVVLETRQPASRIGIRITAGSDRIERNRG